MAKLRIIAALLFGLLGSRAGFLVAQFNASNTALSPLPLVIAERQTTPPQAAVAFAPSVVTNNTDENLNVRLIGRWSTGPCMTVTATENNNLVYVGRGGWFEILNFADPRSPTLLGKLLLPGPVLDIVINATYAYVATGPTGLQILDIANPYRPTILSSLDTPGYAQGLVASAPNDPPYLYLADGDSGLHAISIANPYLPKIKSSIKLTGGALAIDIRGGLYA
ncbi:MAG: hypothetical protein ONB11_08710, partial [candidate division KSB1 bacterium]|nr:hypothetical protein [candidate division KSB1 bacterium]